MDARGASVLLPVLVQTAMLTMLAVLLPLTAAAEVRLVDNVYKELVIGVDERVEPRQCREIIDGIKVCTVRKPSPPFAPLMFMSFKLANSQQNRNLQQSYF